MPATVYRTPENPPRRFDRLLNLPPELWAEIFRFATLIPEPTAPDILGSQPTKDELRDQRLCLKTRSRLPLVCKDWHIATTRLLYQSIFLHSMIVVPQLTQISESTYIYEDAPTKFGFHTTSLTIHVDVFAAELSRLLFSLPNLRYLYLQGGGDYLTSHDREILADALCQCHALEVVCIADHPCIPSEKWSSILSSLPRLRSFTAPFYPHSSNPPAASTAPVIVSNSLTHLDVKTWHWLPLMRLPSLNTFVNHIETLPLFSSTFWETQNLISFLKVHGPHITTLVCVEDNILQFASRTIGLIGTLCSALDVVRLAPSEVLLTGLPDATCPFRLPSTVSLLCLRAGAGNSVQISNRDYRHIFEALGRMEASNLRTVRFTDRRNVLSLKTTHFKVMKYGRDVLAGRGWRFEGSDGELL